MIGSSGLSWSECGDSFLLHAMPTTHCSNLSTAALSSAVYAGEMSTFDLVGSGGGASALDDLAADDFDYNVDCGDFLF